MENGKNDKNSHFDVETEQCPVSTKDVKLTFKIEKLKN